MSDKYFDKPPENIRENIVSYIETQIRDRVYYRKYNDNESYPGDLIVSYMGYPSENTYSINIIVFKKEIFDEIEKVCEDLKDWLNSMSEDNFFFNVKYKEK
jgi:hypothetical protein